MRAPEKNRLEWVVFAASTVLIGLVIGTLVYFEVTRPRTPPEIVARAVAARPTAGGFAVRVEVENRGGETAANALIEVELTGAGVKPERAELTIPMVPHGSVRTGEVIFARDPGSGTLRARVIGYELP